MAGSLSALGLVSVVAGTAWLVRDTTVVTDMAPRVQQFDRGNGGTPAASELKARQLAAWVRRTGDNRSRPFAIVDKQTARVHVHSADGREVAVSPVLVGSARGDDSVPGIGERPVNQIRPSERITPSGRFESEPGVNVQGEDIVWIDYDAAVSLHRVRPTVASERRLERLASPRPQDQRITYGCINVPADFYETHIRPSLGQAPGVVYVLPETRSWSHGQGTTL
ncbi:MAG: L,D-transpeptidase [Pseudomonadota bacterium]